MANKITVEQKLKILESPGITGVLSDILKELESDMGHDSEGAGEIAYMKYSSRMIQRLKVKYKETIQGNKMMSQQTSLLTLIENIKSGEEPEFRNKLDSKFK